MGPMLCNKITRQSKCSGSGAHRIVDVATEVHAMVDGKAGLFVAKEVWGVVAEDL